MPAELSDYEKQRLANIARNQSVLAELGLTDGECKLKPPPPPKKRPLPRKDDDDDEEPQQPTRKSARVANAPVCYTELSDEFCLREEKKLAALERVSSRPQRECKSITSYSDQQAEEIMANEEANATKRKQRARLQQQEEQRQRAALAAAAYAANPRPARHDSAIRAAAGFKEEGALLALRADVEPAQRRHHSRPQLHADCGRRRAAAVRFGTFARDVRGLERCGPVCK